MAAQNRPADDPAGRQRAARRRGRTRRLLQSRHAPVRSRVDGRVSHVRDVKVRVSLHGIARWAAWRKACRRGPAAGTADLSRLLPPRQAGDLLLLDRRCRLPRQPMGEGWRTRSRDRTGREPFTRPPREGRPQSVAAGAHHHGNARYRQQLLRRRHDRAAIRQPLALAHVLWRPRLLLERRRSDLHNPGRCLACLWPRRRLKERPLASRRGRPQPGARPRRDRRRRLRALRRPAHAARRHEWRRRSRPLRLRHEPVRTIGRSQLQVWPRTRCGRQLLHCVAPGAFTDQPRREDDRRAGHRLS